MHTKRLWQVCWAQHRINTSAQIPDSFKARPPEEKKKHETIYRNVTKNQKIRNQRLAGLHVIVSSISNEHTNRWSRLEYQLIPTANTGRYFHVHN